MNCPECLEQLQTFLDGSAIPEREGLQAHLAGCAPCREWFAAALGRPVGTVKTWLHRARLEVLDHLKRRGMVSDETIPDRVSSGAPPIEG